MRLGLIDRGPSEKKGKEYYIKDVMGNYLEKIAPLFSHIDLCASLYMRKVLKKSYAHYKLQIPNVAVLDLGLPRQKSRIVSILWFYAKLIKFFFRQVRKWDILYVFLPGYAGTIASVISRVFGKPYFVYMGGDWKDVSSYAWRWPGIEKKVLFPIYHFLNGHFEKMVTRHSAFALVHGNALQKRYKHLGDKIVLTVPMIDLTEKDIFLRDGSIDADGVHCIFVGTLIPVKGLIYLIQALAILKERGFTITLDLIGTSDESYEQKLRKVIHALHLNGSVTFRGYVPNGPRLLQIYRESDILVLPTLSEGFPRVLYEAMSQSLPIVTTPVGGISGLMEHEVNALLVPPKNPEAIAQAVERLIIDRELRGNVIQNGIKTIRELVGKDPKEQLELLLHTFVPHYKKWAENHQNGSARGPYPGKRVVGQF
ncbi:MAG: glycosyltransferase family 4 protein [Methanomassiliicoccales archaeon]|nr:MAG: glycosyltransferase family 4 protein [Methanomassiliicoccales archaeon]